MSTQFATAERDHIAYLLRADEQAICSWQDIANQLNVHFNGVTLVPIGIHPDRSGAEVEEYAATNPNITPDLAAWNARRQQREANEAAANNGA